MRRVTVLVCGNPMRGDDAVGRAILGALSPATASLAAIRPLDGLMPDDLVDADGPVIVVDAVHGPPPGEVVDLPLVAVAAPDRPVGASSSHALGLPAVVAVARALRGGRLEGRFVGVAGASWEHGAALSGVAAAAVPVATRHLAHWIRVLAHARVPAVSSCA